MPRFDLAHPIPLLILSDGPDCKTGLGRICHDLAWLLSSMPEFKVGVLGRQSVGRARYPWANYGFPESGQWGEHYIEPVWNDLSQGCKGIILTIWDASRLLWFSNPIALGESLKRFLESGQFERWGYFMQDSDGIRPGMLPLEVAAVIDKYDRVLLASKWGWEIAARSVQHPDMDWMPHGINREVFKPVNRLYARSGWGITDKDIVIGCVMSNQERKHWSTVMEAVARMESKPWLWVHSDQDLKSWNLTALAVEYGIADRILSDRKALTDAELAMRYSACDATVVISGGEGFCYPVAESLSCGTPVVTGSYGAQAELVQDHTLPPSWIKVETNHNVRRAYYDAATVAAMLERVVKQKREDGLDTTKWVEHLNWKELGIQWKKWFKRGLA